jgi:ribonuclease-3
VQTQESAIQRIEEILGYQFKDAELIRRALRHASIADGRLDSNERLEFLGDAVLGMVVCDYLFETFDDLLEGELTKIKSAAVSRRTCATIANELQLDSLLELGKGMKTRSKIPSSLSAAVLESVIGALYIDGGIDKVRDWLIPLLEPMISRAAESGHQHNFKSVLQHYAQRNMPGQPIYVMLDEKGPDHAKCFQVCVDIGERRFESCWAASKKQAEQRAALVALEELDLIERTDEGHVVYTGSNGNGEGNGAGSQPSTTLPD